MKNEPQIEEILNHLTIEEKASLTGGANSIDLSGLPEHGIPPFHMIDGPQGVRLESGPTTTAQKMISKTFTALYLLQWKMQARQ